jgi:TRAP-type uncharacterized transport system fused permease subunit
MYAKRILSVFLLLTVFFVYATYDLQAAAIQTPTISHVVTSQELHQAVQDSNQKANEARRAVQDFLNRPEVQTQLQRVGIGSEKVMASVAMLRDAEVLVLQQQIMKADLQNATAGGLTKGGKIMTVIGLAIVGAGVVMIAKGGVSAVDNNTGIDWRKTGYAWVGVGGVLTIIGLTRRTK